MRPVIPDPDGLIIWARDNERLPVADVQPPQPRAVEWMQKYREHILLDLENKCS